MARLCYRVFFLFPPVYPLDLSKTIYELHSQISLCRLSNIPKKGNIAPTYFMISIFVIFLLFLQTPIIVIGTL